MCPYQPKFNHNQDFRKTRCLLNKKLCKYTASLEGCLVHKWDTPSRDYLTSQVEFHTLWGSLDRIIPQAQCSVHAKMKHCRLVLHASPLWFTFRTKLNVFLLLKQQPQRPGPACERVRKSSKCIFTVTCLDFCKPKLGATSWLWLEFMTQKWPNLFFLNKKILKVSPTAWKLDNSACSSCCFQIY